MLVGKWQDNVYNFQEVRKKFLELVPKFGPSFEEDKAETFQSRSGSNLEPEVKDKQQANLETKKELKT
jgi:hypothetical protein